jgi:hypothetical protein
VEWAETWKGIRQLGTSHGRDAHDLAFPETAFTNSATADSENP